VYVSRLKSPLERIQQLFTTKQPYRCHQCGWRQWCALEPRTAHEPDVEPDDLKTGRVVRPVTPAELDSLEP
jgi:hypothetical protein